MKELLNPELDQEIERIRCELQQIEARISDSNQVRQAGGVPSVSQASAPAIRLTPKFCLYCMGMGFILGCFVYWVAGNL